MKNIAFRLSALVIILFVLCLCYRHSKMESRRQLGDTIWNDSVQDTFYGATFGDSIPMVKEKLEKNGFRFVSHGSDNESLCFMPKSDRTFNFSNMIWTTLYIQSSRDCKFIGILFLSSFYDKEGALFFYDDLKSYVKYQYALTEVKVTDPTEYAMSYALGKNKVCANLMCYQFESLENKLEIGVRYTIYCTKANRHVQSTRADAHGE